MHASQNPQVYALNDKSRVLKTPEHVSSLKTNFMKIGGTNGLGKFSDTTCYALDLREILNTKNMKQYSPKHRNIT